MAHTNSPARPHAVASDRPRRPDQRLSPKVRRLLRTRRLTPEQVAGTGPSGRITPADVTAVVSSADARANSSHGTGPDRHDRCIGLASPLARRLLREAGLGLAAVDGTGPGGRVTHDDARRAVTGSRRPRGEPVGAPAADDAGAERAPRVAAGARGSTDRSQTVALTRRRRTIAERMHRSLQTSAQLTAAVEVDLTRLMTDRRRTQPVFEQRTGSAQSPFPLIASAACEVLARHPVLNARIDTEAGTATYFRDVHLGVAVDTEHGLVVPTIRGAQELDVTDLARRIDEVTSRAREQQLRPADVTEGTFTITDAGSRGVLFDTPILEPPQVGILATTLIEKRPVVVTDAFGGEAVAIRQRSYLCLTYDHRLVDGADAARFLADLKHHLETTESLGESAG